jgi:hypothetical protein
MAGETFQAIGALSQMWMANEAVWGTLNPSPNVRKLRTIPGETLDINLSILRSKQIRGDRMRNASVRGNQDPGGSLPFELSPNGWNHFFYHLLGGSVVTTGPSGGLPGATPPTVVPTGTAGTTHYGYKVTATNAAGETLPSTEGTTTTGNAALTGVNYNALTWSAVAGATGYKVYGRASGGPWLLIATLGAVLLYSDTGAVTPAGSPPVVDSSGSAYTHVIKGGTTLPVGFTMEKGFTDAGVYIPFYGGRINKAIIKFTQDQIVTGTFDALYQQQGAPSGSTIFTGATPVAPIDAPYVSAQCQVYEGTSLTLLGIATDLTLTVENQLYAKNGFIIGSNFRQNLKPGDRITTCDGKFMFQNATLYNEAVNGTNTKLRIVASNGIYTWQVDLPTFQFLPMKTTPTIHDEGPLEVTANGEANPDQGLGSDIQVTITTAEASITT